MTMESFPPVMFGGLILVLLALPASAVLLVGLRRLRQTYLASPMYRQGTAAQDQDRAP